MRSLGFALLLACQAAVAVAGASGLVAPGDADLRDDLQLLDDRGLIHVPLSSWPLSADDLAGALADVDATALDEPVAAALYRVNARLRRGADRVQTGLALSAAHAPVVLRTFADTPREQGEVRLHADRRGERLAVTLRASGVIDPNDGSDVRPDGSSVAMAAGNWILSAGWEQRWWGPGHDGSLVLSTNARPFPAVALRRNRSHAFGNRWLSWLGPWTATTFLGQLDDDRLVDDALLFGLRFTFRPTRDLEIGLSRTAQWCGSGRPCGGNAFLNLLLGRDNRGVNVSPEEEPGNQLAGVDVRWSLPTARSSAVYLQWIGEDTRRGGPELGSWLRMAGVEAGGSLPGFRYRTHFEVAETGCRRGGLGFSGTNPDCGYEHSVYGSGYRYEGRSLGHGVDGDGFTYSLGTTLVQSGGHRWNALLRYSEINRVGEPSATHSLARSSLEQLDVTVGHGRRLSSGSLSLGLGWRGQHGQALAERRGFFAYAEWRSW